MHRAQPVANRVCDDKWKQRNYEMHMKKLQKMKPSVDISSPQQFRHLVQNRKKAQMEEERYTQIEHDNRILLKKMTEIMQKPQLDDINDVQFKSLNREYRKRELMKITQENQAILRRIQMREPTYKSVEWEQERLRNEKYCKNICQYPYILAGKEEGYQPEYDEDQELSELRAAMEENASLQEDARRIQSVIKGGSGSGEYENYDDGEGAAVSGSQYDDSERAE